MTLKEYIDDDPDGLGLTAMAAAGDDAGIAPRSTGVLPCQHT